MPLQVRRIYEEAQPQDGFRVLVDRLWPRGITKERAAIDLWLKEIAPSTELRKWFNHGSERFSDFTAGYISELKENPAVDQLLDIMRPHPVVTLLYGAKDENINHAVVLADYLAEL